ncbi:uncharacterized protein LOC110008452 [Amborella trichopoda]|uniref:uncharacterized protein LOC110008452 n=1 Tax=Amborella trichopoda TaxID=13333 RepID=UPI0009BF3AE3|nr:uncharacterized protein LOC110008452 [Amborella trichopoda]|eukprot:XP_020531622.1 uncharacterized protein LOC110008452 [Amborella trichopoda]
MENASTKLASSTHSDLTSMRTPTLPVAPVLYVGSNPHVTMCNPSSSSRPVCGFEPTCDYVQSKKDDLALRDANLGWRWQVREIAIHAESWVMTSAIGPAGTWCTSDSQWWMTSSRGEVAEEQQRSIAMGSTSKHQESMSNNPTQCA